MDSPKASAKGCFKSVMVGFGCGCIYPAVFAVIAMVVIFYTLSAPFHQLTQPPQLPSFAGPEQEDFWSLQEKRLDLDATVKRQIKLTEPEFNAYLSFLEFPPAGGVCINRCKFIIKPEYGTFYLLSSGFFMRSLIIRIELSRDEAPAVMAIRFNGYTVTSNSILFPHALAYIESLLAYGTFNPVKEIKDKSNSFTFDDQGIVLTGNFIR